MIEAGIARAVVATSDPDPRVSGHGIEQLRAAGVAVEVGLCEGEALRLNETYFKFVTTRTPFIHSVVEYAATEADSTPGWEPSRRFLDMAYEYDLIGAGHDARVNAIVLNSCSNRSRHRQLIVCGVSDHACSAPGIEKLEAMFIKFEPPAGSGVGAQPDLAAMFRPLGARLNVTSVLLLPGFLGIHSSAIIQQSDKLTVIARRADEANSQRLKSICSALMPDAAYVQNFDAGSYVEYTGYPRRSSSQE